MPVNKLANTAPIKKNMEYVVQIKLKGKVIAQETLAGTDEILGYTRERQFEMTHDIAERVAPKAVEKACIYFDKKIKKND